MTNVEPVNGLNGCISCQPWHSCNRDSLPLDATTGFDSGCTTKPCPLCDAAILLEGSNE